MKKMLSIVAILALLVVSCGPSAKEIEEKRVSDSIVMADSIALVQAEQQKVADSIAAIEVKRVADSIAAIKPVKKGKK